MKWTKIGLIALGIGTLVACGSSDAPASPDKDEAEQAAPADEAKGDKDAGEADEAKDDGDEGDEADGDEGGEEAGDGGAAADTVCCHFKNKKGELVKKNLAPAACTKRKGKELPGEECADD